MTAVTGSFWIDETLLATTVRHNMLCSIIYLYTIAVSKALAEWVANIAIVNPLEFHLARSVATAFPLDFVVQVRAVPVAQHSKLSVCSVGSCDGMVRTIWLSACSVGHFSGRHAPLGLFVQALAVLLAQHLRCLKRKMHIVSAAGSIVGRWWWACSVLWLNEHSFLNTRVKHVSVSSCTSRA